jgi:hypothetical protein
LTSPMTEIQTSTAPTLNVDGLSPIEIALVYLGALQWQRAANHAASIRRATVESCIAPMKCRYLVEDKLFELARRDASTANAVIESLRLLFDDEAVRMADLLDDAIERNRTESERTESRRDHASRSADARPSGESRK